MEWGVERIPGWPAGPSGLAGAHRPSGCTQACVCGGAVSRSVSDGVTGVLLCVPTPWGGSSVSDARGRGRVSLMLRAGGPALAYARHPPAAVTCETLATLVILRLGFGKTGTSTSGLPGGTPGVEELTVATLVMFPPLSRSSCVTV